MAGLKEEGKILGKQAHFESVNPEKLDERDMQIYETILNFDLKTGDVDELFKIIHQHKEELEVTGNETQKVFLAYLANLVQGKVEKDLIR